MIKTFQELQVWQKAHRLVLLTYKVTKAFPKEELYGLVSQLRRSAASIPTNIAEGYKRRGAKDYARFVNMADASLEETKYHLILARDLEYMDLEHSRELADLCDEVGKMLNGLYRSLLGKNQ
ncbi:MAG: four helix bundle protein [Candidatus Omnitrophota bacterium]